MGYINSVFAKLQWSLMFGYLSVADLKSAPGAIYRSGSGPSVNPDCTLTLSDSNMVALVSIEIGHLTVVLERNGEVFIQSNSSYPLGDK